MSVRNLIDYFFIYSFSTLIDALTFYSETVSAHKHLQQAICMSIDKKLFLVSQVLKNTGSMFKLRL